jgi:hypothetical protein
VSKNNMLRGSTKTHTHTNTNTHTHTNAHKRTQTHTQTHRQTDRHTNKQTNKQTNTHNSLLTCRAEKRPWSSMQKTGCLAEIQIRNLAKSLFFRATFERNCHNNNHNHHNYDYLDNCCIFYSANATPYSWSNWLLQSPIDERSDSRETRSQSKSNQNHHLHCPL